jgi:hypothetical protein
MVAYDVGVHFTVQGQLTGRRAGVVAKVEVHLATSAVAKGVREAGDGGSKECRVEVVLVGRGHEEKFTGEAAKSDGNLKEPI